MNKDVKFVDVYLTSALALGAINIPMVVIEAWAYEEKGEWIACSEVYKVLAIRSEMKHRYSGRFPVEQRVDENLSRHDDLIAAGFRPQGSLTVTNPIVFDSELGFCTPEEMAWTNDEIYKTVEVTWNPDDDAPLKAIRQQLENEALGNAKIKGKKKAA